MFGRYLWPAIIIGIVAYIIAAIFNVSSIWAEVGFALGLAVMLILDWSNSWRTVLGTFVGGLIGYGLTYLIPNKTWGECVFLLFVIIGGCLASEVAWEDVIRQSNRSYRGSSDSSSDRAPYRDATGREKSYVAHYCHQCCFYDNTNHTCRSSSQYIDPYTPSCSAFSR